MSLIVLLLIAIVIIFAVEDIRKNLISRPVFTFFKRILPPMSDTEREAMESGTVWWDAQLFSGSPDWKGLHKIPQPKLSEEEREFLNTHVETLLAMVDDYKIVSQDRDLPKKVWDYLKKHGFFSMIIPKAYGGLEFSAIACSTIVSRISTRSLSVAVTVMVPNSLGPGELLMHYGTEKQKKYWLPRLAKGQDIPCFALTSPEAGSDAGSIPDVGIVCKGEFEGKEVLGISLTWNKRYITLAPVATVLGLAFKLRDPDGLLGDIKEVGITCALIPTSHPGVEIGKRHDPVNMAFMNGTTSGENVFVPLEWIIGGEDYAGRGWRMLVECLSAGRGVSLPALSTAIGHLASRTTGAYAYIRKQFGLSIGKFEGVQEPLARIQSLNYQLESMRKFTAGALDQGESPSVCTALSKYHMTEMGRQLINDAMDIHSGKGIQLGPKNYLAAHYFGIPVAITVEGANILTRNLMIFGQGATRCHPYVYPEMEAAANPDEELGLQQFDNLLIKHIGFTIKNLFTGIFMGLTAAKFASYPVSGETQRYYQILSRFSRALALVTDFSMLTMGGDLKRKEMLSARLGDVLSYLYIASAVLKRFEDEGRQQADLPLVKYSVQSCLYKMSLAFQGIFLNFGNRPVAFFLKWSIFPWGMPYKPINDELARSVASTAMELGVARERWTHLCYIGDKEDDAVGIVERAFVAAKASEKADATLSKALKSGELEAHDDYDELLTSAVGKGIIHQDDSDKLALTRKLVAEACAVDAFDSLPMKPKPMRTRKKAATKKTDAE